MFNTGETLEDIERWAEATFPHEFKAVKDYLIENNITAKEYVQWDEPTHRSVQAVHVGRALGPTVSYSAVYAHVTSHETLPLAPRVVLRMWDEEDQDTYSFIERYETRFKKPFRWLNPWGSTLGVERFNAFIMFICPPSAMPAGVSIDASYFKKHFEGVCRVIAEELEEQRRQDRKCKWCSSTVRWRSSDDNKDKLQHLLHTGPLL